MDRCKYINASNEGCCCDNLDENIICESCEPFIIENIDRSKIEAGAANIFRIIDYKKLNYSDFAMNSIVLFRFDDPNTRYSSRDKMTIETIQTTYDFIGLEELNLTHSQIFIDGNEYFLTPENKLNVSKNETPVYIFNSAIGSINSDNLCCCNSVDDEFIRVRVVEPDNFFDVNNLSIKISGYINNKPFSATADFYNLTSPNISSIGLTSLGILSAVTFDTDLCLMKSRGDTYIKEEFESYLNAYCANFYGNCDSAVSSDVFYASVNFYISIVKTIYSLKKENLNLYLYNGCSMGKDGNLHE